MFIGINSFLPKILIFTNTNLILDFEWALAGDPEMEFRDLFTHTEGWQYFTEGYLSKRTLTDQFEAKNHLYQLQNALELSIVAQQHWDEAAQQWVRGRVRELVKKT